MLQEANALNIIGKLKLTILGSSIDAYFKDVLRFGPKIGRGVRRRPSKRTIRKEKSQNCEDFQ